MNAHTRKTLQAIQGHPAPRELEWKKFVTLWSDLADEVEEESGDRLAVKINGHREVFHRPNDGRVSIEDIERARHLLAEHPTPEGHGHVLAVTIDELGARIIDFDLDAQNVQERSEKVGDDDPRTRHLRTIERHTGRDDEADMTHFFDALAEELAAHDPGRGFVVFGHGKGTSDAAAGFVARVQEKHRALAPHVLGVEDIDLSAATDASLEAAAKRVVGA